MICGAFFLLASALEQHLRALEIHADGQLTEDAPPDATTPPESMLPLGRGDPELAETVEQPPSKQRMADDAAVHGRRGKGLGADGWDALHACGSAFWSLGEAAVRCHTAGREQRVVSPTLARILTDVEHVYVIFKDCKDLLDDTSLGAHANVTFVHGDTYDPCMVKHDMVTGRGNVVGGDDHCSNACCSDHCGRVSAAHWGAVADASERGYGSVLVAEADWRWDNLDSPERSAAQESALGSFLQSDAWSVLRVAYTPWSAAIEHTKGRGWNKDWHADQCNPGCECATSAEGEVCQLNEDSCEIYSTAAYVLPARTFPAFLEVLWPTPGEKTPRMVDGCPMWVFRQHLLLPPLGTQMQPGKLEHTKVNYAFFQKHCLRSAAVGRPKHVTKGCKSVVPKPQASPDLQHLRSLEVAAGGDLSLSNQVAKLAAPAQAYDPPRDALEAEARARPRFAPAD